MPLWRWAYDSVRASGLQLIVVTGDVELDVPEAVHNPSWRDGIATSLQVAMATASAGGADAIVVGLADQPMIPAEAWQLVAASTAPIAVATYGGARRNPVRLARSVWPELPTTGDQGASVLFRDHAVVEVACPGNPGDVDRLEDLEQWS
ncbi:MAG: molybdenum cofactor cytidylyltransferase [Actinomycetota bacterium]|nr:molybdenum cofactor cytidylyltransferase [Actinomycetota bacterium]